MRVGLSFDTREVVFRSVGRHMCARSGGLGCDVDGVPFCAVIIGGIQNFACINFNARRRAEGFRSLK